MISSLKSNPQKNILSKQDAPHRRKSSPEEHFFETGCSPLLKIIPGRTFFQIRMHSAVKTATHTALIPRPPHAATVLNLGGLACGHALPIGSFFMDTASPRSSYFRTDAYAASAPSLRIRARSAATFSSRPAIFVRSWSHIFSFARTAWASAFASSSLCSQ